MKLVTYQAGQDVRPGVLDAQNVIDASGVAPDVQALLESIVERGVSAVAESLKDAPRMPLSAVKLLAPIPRPRKNIFCVGKNYHEHAKEFAASGFDSSAKEATPALPIVFSKPATTVIGPLDTIPAHLDPTESVDYENELAVIIGKPGRGIGAADAYRHVIGYTIVNDVTSRTLQRDHKQWYLGKGIDGFCPMGPVIVTADEIADVGALRLRTVVNDVERQNAQVKDLIFDIPTLIETISRTMTLGTGDIIATGTPAGVGIGENPPRFLKKGDQLVLSIDGIGVLSNTVG
jgi:2-keto-4-pentenoate hydratase/2-oxohepta-3-ene-1,7-dioic acid hydratase in catechol pathway